MTKSKKVTAGHWLDWRRIKKDKTYPIKIRVTYNRRSKFFDSGQSLTAEQYEKILGSGRKLSNELESVKAKLAEDVIWAREAGNSLDVFTWEGFKKVFHKIDESDPSDLIGVLRSYEQKLRDEGRIGSADTYRTTAKSLISFLKSRGIRNPEVLPFESCTVTFLESYKGWLLSEKGGVKKTNSLTTVGYHSRNIRRAWKIGIDSYGVKAELYPFGINKFKIPQPVGRKKFLDESKLKKVFGYSPKDKVEQKYYDFWILSFLLAGANMRDLCQLRYGNIITKEIEGNERFQMISYTRHKVALISKKSAIIQIPLSGYNRDMVESIIKRYWKGEGGNPNDYVFNILDEKDDGNPERQTALIKQFTKMVNTYMGRISIELKLKESITTYYARHTFASILARNNYSADFIRPLMGHSSVKTTEIYLAGFPDEDVASAMESLIPETKE